jgi:hypothetical protein
MAPTSDFLSQFGETLIDPSDDRRSKKPNDALADKDFVSLAVSIKVFHE